MPLLFFRGTLLAIDECTCGGNDERNQEIEEDFGSHTERKRLGKEHIELICGGEEATDNRGEKAIAPEHRGTEDVAQAARELAAGFLVEVHASGVRFSSHLRSGTTRDDLTREIHKVRSDEGGQGGEAVQNLSRTGDERATQARMNGTCNVPRMCGNHQQRFR
jgi:hypothetical protein